MWYPIVLKLYSLTITHKADVGGVQLNLRDPNAVKAAFQAIKPSVNEKVGAEHFQGVTVQPMVKLDGYELIIGSSLEVWINAIGDLAEVIQGYTSVASERSGCSVQSSLLVAFDRLGSCSRRVTGHLCRFPGQFQRDVFVLPFSVDCAAAHGSALSSSCLDQEDSHKKGHYIPP